MTEAFQARGAACNPSQALAQLGDAAADGEDLGFAEAVWVDDLQTESLNGRVKIVGDLAAASAGWEQGS